MKRVALVLTAVLLCGWLGNVIGKDVAGKIRTESEREAVVIQVAGVDPLQCAPGSQHERIKVAYPTARVQADIVCHATGGETGCHVFAKVILKHVASGGTRELGPLVTNFDCGSSGKVDKTWDLSTIGLPSGTCTANALIYQGSDILYSDTVSFVVP